MKTAIQQKVRWWMVASHFFFWASIMYFAMATGIYWMVENHNECLYKTVVKNLVLRCYQQIALATMDSYKLRTGGCRKVVSSARGLCCAPWFRLMHFDAYEIKSQGTMKNLNHHLENSENCETTAWNCMENSWKLWPLRFFFEAWKAFCWFSEAGALILAARKLDKILVFGCIIPCLMCFLYWKVLKS